MNAIEKQALRLIAENLSSPDVFTDDDAGMAQIRTSLNDAIQELCLATGSYTKTYFLPLLAGKQFYRLAPVADFFAYALTVWDREHHYRLIRTDFSVLNDQDPFWLRREGRPLQYVMSGFDFIGFYPMPSEEGKVLEITMACIPKPYLTDTDPIKVREQFQRALVQYAVGEFFASRGDAKRAQEFFDRYMETAGVMEFTPDYAEMKSTFLSPYGKSGEWNSRSGQ